MTTSDDPDPVPHVIEREEQPFAAIRDRIPMSGIAALADRVPEVFDWLGTQGVDPAGPVFFRYTVIDMAGLLEMEVGVPVAVPLGQGDGDLVVGVLPSGRYLTTRHTGHPQSLEQATGELLAWAARHGYTWDVQLLDDGEHWGCRLEEYLSDPVEQPDLDTWQTDLTFRLAD